MTTLWMTNVGDVYRYVERLMSECRKCDESALFKQLDDALHLGSSGLEMLGAIRRALIENRVTVVRLLGPTGKEEADRVIAFVDKAFGR